jgi:protein-disulfide isomerase
MTVQSTERDSAALAKRPANATLRRHSGSLLKTMEFKVITRRTLLIGASSVAMIAALGGFEALIHAQPAAAQNIPPMELLVPPALGDRALGKDDAPVTIVEYASMTCPHCAHFHETTYPELKKRYIDTGKVRFIFREFPLDPLAAGASMLARCADKDKFYPLIETLFQLQRQWAVEKPIPPLLAIAKQAGFTEQSFNACLSDQKTLDAMQEEQKRATDKFKVNSTPTIFVNGKMVKGGVSIEELAKIIDPLLKAS